MRLVPTARPICFVWASGFDRGKFSLNSLFGGAHIFSVGKKVFPYLFYPPIIPVSLLSYLRLKPFPRVLSVQFLPRIRLDAPYCTRFVV